MGINPASFWANIYLHRYEVKYIMNLIGLDRSRALKFRNASRFIDDECNLNDDGEFGQSYLQIYP